MDAATSPPVARLGRLGWGVLLTVSGLLVLNGLLLYFVIAESPQVQTIGILMTGLGALALAVAIEGFRAGARWAWSSMWVVVGVMAAVTLHMLGLGRPDLVGLYAVLGALTCIGLLMARRDMRA